MRLYSENENYKLYHGNMLDMLEVIEPNSIDSIVTDPPNELNFMGKGWDNSGIAFQKETWQKCYEVLKSGGYLLAFGGSRTFHRIACAIEDAGFEIRDTICWMYGMGFPKSMNIGKALEKRWNTNGKNNRKQISEDRKALCEHEMRLLWERDIQKSKSDENQQNEVIEYWNKFGTALKPSFEPIIVARKPFKGSLVDNVIKNGVGGINIDECRVATNDTWYRKEQDTNTAIEYQRKNKSMYAQKSEGEMNENGRFPANTILTYDETDFDEVCGGFPNTKGSKPHARGGTNFGIGIENDNRKNDILSGFNDSGSASRYFMNCKYTEKDEEIWKQLLVNNVENNLEILKATKDNIVQMNVEDLLKELKDHYAKYVDNQLDLIETPIVQDIVEILTWDFKIGTSQVIQDFIINSKKCIQFLNLVQFVEKMDNIDTTQTTQNLLKLFGYVKVVITNYIQGNIEYDQKRYIYTPKASKKDRDEGLDEFKIKGAKELLNREENSDGASWNGKYSSGNAFAGAGCPKKNTHPTVKPTELMQYLVRLVTPNGGTVLDPFNGSGSTGKAVMYENHERDKNYKYVGIELTEEYLPISKARIEYVCNLPKEQRQADIFDYLEDDNE